MLYHIENLVDAPLLAQCRSALQNAQWVSGRETAGHVAQRAKNNLQLHQQDPLTKQLGDLLLEQLVRHPAFMSAALPLKVFPPRFNCYQQGGDYGNHIDGAVLSVPGSAERVRTDLSATVFFSEPEEYDGGELVIEDTYGTQTVKLPAGHMVLYPGTSLHRVTPVTRGVRLAAFFWIQSLVRDDAQRSLLWQLDRSIATVTQEQPESPAISQLTGIYHNLLRQWSET